jgi:MarR family transcriptional regulator, 2-MHQ and catechol-resistance regulon repressor
LERHLLFGDGFDAPLIFCLDFDPPRPRYCKGDEPRVIAERTALKQANTDGTHVFLIVWKTYRTLLAKADASIKKVGLCDSDFRVLEALLHKGPLPVNVIGEKVELTTGSITTAVDRMEAKWLVVRKRHPRDRRVRLVELTTKGRRLIEYAYAQHAIDMERAAKTLSPRERATIVRLLKRLGKS